MLIGTDFDITNNSRRKITLPQRNAKQVSIEPGQTKRVQVFSANANNVRKWGYIGMITVVKHVPTPPPPATP